MSLEIINVSYELTQNHSALMALIKEKTGRVMIHEYP